MMVAPGTPSVMNCIEPLAVVDGSVALDIVRRPKATPIHELERYIRCRDCTQLRGYPYKRGYLVAVRTANISADQCDNWETRSKIVASHMLDGLRNRPRRVGYNVYFSKVQSYLK
jgi:hypothetical protein